ncbi:MAG: hypothetical protein QM756_19740 [Polyangiaceae bacterium]
MRRVSIVCSVLVLLACALGCAPKRKASSQKGALKPLTAPTWLASLPVAGFGEARAALPLLATEPRPVLLALHGGFDRPEWQCGSYRGITHGRSFILCPRGVPVTPQAFGLGSPDDSERELRAAITGLKARFGAHVASGPVVLSALGPSVEHALSLALKEPSFFSHLVLVNGSLSRLTPAFATRFGASGGKRVLAVCSPGGCDADSDRRVSSLRPAGVEARLVLAERGQGLDGDIAALLEKQWSWLVASEPRWK